MNAMRAAVYARFSSENQREQSIEDQVRVCRSIAAREEHGSREPHLLRRSPVRLRAGAPRARSSEEGCRSASKHPRRGEVVFAAPDGTMLSKGAMRWPLWNACKDAGLRRIGWHVARHTFANHLVMRCAPLEAVQKLMGHSTIEMMTMRYTPLSPDARRDAVRLLHVKDSVTLVWRTSKGDVLRLGLPHRASVTARRLQPRRCPKR